VRQVLPALADHEKQTETMNNQHQCKKDCSGLHNVQIKLLRNKGVPRTLSLYQRDYTFSLF
jgi:hypothetical protein